MDGRSKPILYFEEDWIEAKWDACFGLREFFGSNNAPSFNKQDMQVSRFILEGVHLAIDLCIVLPRRITKLYELFERVVAMNVLIRSHQDGIDPILYLKDLAMEINQPSTSRKLSQCAGKQFADKLHQAFMVPDNSFEAGLLDGLFAIGQGITEPMEVVTYIGAGGEAAC